MDADIKQKRFPVYSMVIAGQLMSIGHVCRIERNYKDLRKYVFLFRDTEQFQEDLKQLIG